MEQAPGRDWWSIIKYSVNTLGFFLFMLYLVATERDRQGFISIAQDIHSDLKKRTSEVLKGEEEKAPSPQATEPESERNFAQVFASLLEENQNKCIEIAREFRSCIKKSNEEKGKIPHVSYQQALDESEALTYGDLTYPLSDTENEVDLNNQVADLIFHEADSLHECLESIEPKVNSSWMKVGSLRLLENMLWKEAPRAHGVLVEMLQAHEESCTAATSSEEISSKRFDSQNKRFDQAAADLRALFTETENRSEPLHGSNLESALREYAVDQVRAPGPQIRAEAYRQEEADYQLWLKENELRRQDELRREEERRKWQRDRLNRESPRELPKLKLAPGAAERLRARSPN